MCELIDIYPKFADRIVEFSCIRKFTSGSASNWHMLCSYNSITGEISLDPIVHQNPCMRKAWSLDGSKRAQMIHLK